MLRFDLSTNSPGLRCLPPQRQLGAGTTRQNTPLNSTNKARAVSTTSLPNGLSELKSKQPTNARGRLHRSRPCQPTAASTIEFFFLLQPNYKNQQRQRQKFAQTLSWSVVRSCLPRKSITRRVGEQAQTGCPSAATKKRGGCERGINGDVADGHATRQRQSSR